MRVVVAKNRGHDGERPPAVQGWYVAKAVEAFRLEERIFLCGPALHGCVSVAKNFVGLKCGGLKDPCLRSEPRMPPVFAAR